MFLEGPINPNKVDWIEIGYLFEKLGLQKIGR